MVGLPARGKTYIAKKLTRYLKWIGVTTRVFNVGEYRRQATEAYRSHDFFRPDNQEAIAIRSKCALDALEDMCQWLMEDQGEVAVYDATNTTYVRRQMIFDTVVEKYGFKLFFVESICEDPLIVEANIREVKIHSPDYVNMKQDEALNDFLHRIEHYKLTYQTLNEEFEGHLSFMKIFNAGEKVLVHRHEGHIQSRVVYYLMNIHLIPRSIYLTRHGESVYNLCGRIGGDSELSDRGKEYARALANYISEQNIPRLRSVLLSQVQWLHFLTFLFGFAFFLSPCLLPSFSFCPHDFSIAKFSLWFLSLVFSFFHSSPLLSFSFFLSPAQGVDITNEEDH